MTTMRGWTQEEIDAEMLDHEECWQCGGEGSIANCWEEWACVDPEEGCSECRKRCDICKGKGGWSNDA